MKTKNMSKTKTGNSLFLFILIACVISFLPVSNTFAQTPADFTYSDTYGGLTQYDTPGSKQVTITRNGFGRHPVELNYDNSATVYNFQDNAAGRRVVQKRTIGTETVTSHFLFGGGLRPKVEFRNDGTTTTAHYTIYGPGGRVLSYISTDSDGTTTSHLTPIHDRLGSTRALIDSSSGNVEARFGYNTMGKPTETDVCAESGAGDCTEYREYPYRFQGHRYLPFEDETASAGYIVGVTDNVDRLYSHDHGLRFMHTDLAGQSISPYTAYGNDPVNRVDLNGYIDIWEFLDTYLGNNQSVEDLWVSDVHYLGIYPQLAAYIVDSGGTRIDRMAFEGFGHSTKISANHFETQLSSAPSDYDDYMNNRMKVARVDAENELIRVAQSTNNNSYQIGGDVSKSEYETHVNEMRSETGRKLFFAGDNHPKRYSHGTSMHYNNYNLMGEHDLLIRIKPNEVILEHNMYDNEPRPNAFDLATNKSIKVENDFEQLEHKELHTIQIQRVDNGTVNFNYKNNIYDVQVYKRTDGKKAGQFEPGNSILDIHGNQAYTPPEVDTGCCTIL